MKECIFLNSVLCANKILISQQLDLIVFLIAAALSLEIPALEVTKKDSSDCNVNEVACETSIDKVNFRKPFLQSLNLQ